MKRLIVILFLLLIVIVLVIVIPSHIPSSPSLDHATPPSLQPSASLLQPSASSEVHRLRLALGNFLLAVKDPYRPPLGDNRDITRALTGGNRRGLVLVPTNDPSLRDGQLVDPWGTPYWFHPRAPDAIDIVSAGPDRKLFTGDDVGAGRVR